MNVGLDEWVGKIALFVIFLKVFRTNLSHVFDLQTIGACFGKRFLPTGKNVFPDQIALT